MAESQGLLSLRTQVVSVGGRLVCRRRAEVSEVAGLNFSSSFLMNLELRFIGSALGTQARQANMGSVPGPRALGSLGSSLAVISACVH